MLNKKLFFTTYGLGEKLKFLNKSYSYKRFQDMFYVSLFSVPLLLNDLLAKVKEKSFCIK